MAETGDRIRVLHVDDEPDFADVAATFLRREDERFEVRTATGAETGMEALATEEFDCVVSDYDMPGTSGIEFLRAVREEYDDLPFILFTGKGSEEIASDAISAGVTDYLQKEPGTDQYAILANRIRNAVERTRAQRERTRMRERMELALEETHSVIFEFDFDHGAVSRHGAVEEFFGIDPERIGTEDAFTERLVHPEDRERFRSFYEQLRDGERDHDSIEYRTNPDTGPVRWFRDHAYVVSDDGGPERVVGLAQDVTAQKKRERELEQYEAYLQESTDIITVLDEDGHIKYESPSVTRILGYEQGELIGEYGFDLVHPDDVDEIAATFEELVGAPGATVTVVGRFRTADGEWRWLEVRGTNQLDHPAIEGVVTNNRDISERKAQERKREQIIERVTDAIVEVDSGWRFTLVNEQAAALFEMDAEDLLGRDFWEVFAAARGTRFEEAYRSVMETREPASLTEYYAGLDGWFDVEVYPNDGGGIAFYFFEVTDKRERQRELERRNRRFQYVEDVADIGYWEIDPRSPEPHDVTLSDGVYAVHDLEAGDAFDLERGLEFYHPDDRKRVERAVERAISSGEPYDLEARLQTAAGRDRWIHTVGEPIENDGEVVLVRGVFQDITDRKRKEAELARQNERLEEFTSIVSHDLQNPLRVAAGNLELAMEECESERLDDAVAAIERSQTLVEELLTLARQGATVGEQESVDLAAVAQGSWESVATGGASLTNEAAGTIRADPSRLQQLLENLIRNAVEHGGEGVTVSIGTNPDGFFVADDGPGFPAAVRTRAEDSEEWGIGLTIVERIATAHGWDLQLAESESGGARVEVTGVEWA